MHKSTSEDIQHMDVTIYQQNVGLFNEKRRTIFQPDQSQLHITNLPTDMEIDSLLVKGITPSGYSFHTKLKTQEDILRAFIGKTVQFQPLKEQAFAVKILEIDPEIILLRENQQVILVDPMGSFIFPYIDESYRNTHLLLYLEKLDGAHEYALSYLAAGIDWNLRYIIEIKEGKVELTGRASITNRLGIDLEQATVRLVAGVVDNRRILYDGDSNIYSSMSMEPVEPPVRRQDLTNHTVYQVSCPVTIKQNDTMDIPLISETFNSVSPIYEVTNGSGQSKLTLCIDNTSANELPAGKAHLYEEDQDGNLIFIGERYIDKTRVQEQLLLSHGSSNQVTSRYWKSNFERRREYDQVVLNYDITNHSKEEASVILRHTVVEDNWEIEDCSHEYELEERDIVFNLSVSADSTTKIEISLLSYRKRRD